MDWIPYDRAFIVAFPLASVHKTAPQDATSHGAQDDNFRVNNSQTRATRDLAVLGETNLNSHPDMNKKKKQWMKKKK